MAENILREINRGGWSTGYCGQSPERLKAHMANQKDFDVVTRAASVRQGRLLRIAVAVLGHPGAQASRHPHALQHRPESWTAAGRPRAVRCRAQRRLAAGRRVLLGRFGYRDGYPEFTYGVLKKLGWDTT